VIRYRLICSLTLALWGTAFATPFAAQPDLTAWFVRATGYHAATVSRALRTPDFLPGTSLKTMACGATGLPILNGIWVLAKYDRRHNIVLAAASTDQCSVAVFATSPPSVHLPNADLSAYRTGRGLHIGSRYADVLRIYGAPVARYSRHFIATYNATIPATTDTLPRRRVLLPELITLVITNGRVASMTLSVDMGGLY
jgi:hypothetical protein